MRTLAILLLMGCAPAAAQTPASVPVTLEDAIQRATTNSRRLAELEARAEAARFAAEGARVGDRPNVAVQGGYMRTNHVDEFSIAFPGRAPQVVYPDIPDNVRTRLDLQWPIYTGGRAGALERAARAEQSATGEDLAAARADLRLEVTRAFWALVTAGEAETVLARSLDAIDAQVADLRSRLAQGLIPPNDLSSAEAQASHQRLLALEASNQRSTAEADLRRLTADESPGRLEPVVGAAAGAAAEAAPGQGAQRPGIAPETAAVARLIAQALKTRPERRALEDRAASAEERARAVGASGKPQLAVTAGYDYARPNPRIFPRREDWRTSWDLSINATWSLWDSGRRAAQRGEARAAARALRNRVEDFDRQVTFEVRQRQLELASSQEAVRAALDEVRAAREAERVVTERYRVGVATSTDVLEAQVARLQAELDHTRATSNVYLAEARLRRALGT